MFQGFFAKCGLFAHYLIKTFQSGQEGSLYIGIRDCGFRGVGTDSKYLGLGKASSRNQSRGS